MINGMFINNIPQVNPPNTNFIPMPIPNPMPPMNPVIYPNINQGYNPGPMNPNIMINVNQGINPGCIPGMIPPINPNINPGMIQGNNNFINQMGNKNPIIMNNNIQNVVGNNCFSPMQFVHHNNNSNSISINDKMKENHGKSFSDDNNNSYKKSIRFITTTGNSLIVNVSPDTSIKNMIKLYIQKLGLLPEAINSLFFLWSGKKLNKNEEKTIHQLKMENGAIITVLDQKDIVGA